MAPSGGVELLDRPGERVVQVGDGGREEDAREGSADLPEVQIANAWVLYAGNQYEDAIRNAYQAIADLPRVDAVLHLGDYIYEYGGPDSYGMTSAVAGERPHGARP